MTTRQITTCDHCGKEIKDYTGEVSVRIRQEETMDDGVYIHPGSSGSFDFHEACAQRAIQFWDDLNAGRMDSR